MPLIDRIQKWLEGVLVALLAVMVMIVFANVVLRFFFHSGIAQTEELSRYAFVWLTFIGAVIVLREEGHLGVDSFVRMLPPAGRRTCRIVSDLLIIGCCVLFFIGSWYQTASAVGKYSQASSFPMVALFGVGMVASALMIGVTIVGFRRAMRRASLNERGAPCNAEG
jgi:TRAP-type C4-dicarboxylate transport system permease small subunit